MLKYSENYAMINLLLIVIFHNNRRYLSNNRQAVMRLKKEGIIKMKERKKERIRILIVCILTICLGVSTSVPAFAVESISSSDGESDGMELIEIEKAFNLNDAIEVNGNVDSNIAVSSRDLMDEGAFIETVTTITIEKEQAPKEFLFDFNIPKGYTIVEDKESKQTIGSNGIIILDENNEIVDYIEAPLVIDASGNVINSHYSIKGTTLIQTIEFDENNLFPIDVILTSHPTITETAKITKKKTKKVINKIQGQIDDAENFTGSFVYWIIAAGGGYLGGFGIAADAVTTWMIKPTFVKRMKARKTLYNNKYKNMDSNDKLKVVSVRKWQKHGGNDGRYVLRKETLTIIHVD